MGSENAPTTGAPSLDNTRTPVSGLLGPYSALQGESISRVIRLLTFATNLQSQLHFAPDTTNPLYGNPKMQGEAVQEMLRAAVVLTHAYLEDYLRTIGEALLPECDEDTLNAIPLVGLPGRPERFPLGKLVRHKGKQVDEVLRESVREHLSRTTFNNKGEIVKLLEALGFELSEETNELEAIQEMIQRRHQIVHRADKVKTTQSETPVLQPIRSRDAERWLQATNDFMLSLNGPLLNKLAQLEEKALKITAPK